MHETAVLRTEKEMVFFSHLTAETEGENMTFVPLLEGMETNKAFLGKKSHQLKFIKCTNRDVTW